MIPRSILILATSMVFCACSSTARKESPRLDAQTAHIAQAKLYQMSWLAGTWRMHRPDGYTEETWLPPSGGVMLGIGYTLKDQRVKGYEYLRIETRGDTLVYVAHPDGRSPGIEFYLTDLTKGNALFENPEHDFPKWIRYHRKETGSCVATIGGDSGSVEFSYELQE